LAHGLETRPAPEGPVAYPLLLECDLRGHVLWMSERARSVLGVADNLVQIIVHESRGGKPTPAVSPRALCFSCLLATNRWAVISVRPEVEAQDLPEIRNLLGVHGRLLRHCFELQTIERNLFHIIRGRRPGGGGRAAVRQIELDRQRLGRELHTGVGQMLAAIRLQLELLTPQISNPPAPVAAALERISTLAGDALDQVRNISHRLHPPEWQRLSLESALQQLWDISGIPQKYQVSLHIQPLPQEPGLETKVLMYRAAQEALSNLIRHSRATRIEMALEASPGGVKLTIQDNGVGFDVARMFSAPASVAGGIGLRSIRDQAEVLGGRLAIHSSTAGTRVEVSAPWSTEER
jgi:signal transduction histidine kinase